MVAVLEEKLSSPLFLAICIIYSCFTLFTGFLNVFSVLITIGLWIAFAGAKRKTLSSEHHQGLKLLSGTFKAIKIINWISVGLLTVTAVALIAVGPMISNVLTDYSDEIADSIDTAYTSGTNDIENVFEDNEELEDVLGDSDLGQLIKDIQNKDYNALVLLIANMAGVFFVVIGVGLLIYAVIITILNIFYYRNLHKFAKSVCGYYEESSGKLEKLDVVRKWIIVMIVFSGLGVLGSIINPLALLGSISQCAVYVVFYIWLKDLENSASAVAEQNF